MERKSTTMIMTSQTGGSLLPLSIAVDGPASPVEMVEHEQISYEQDDGDKTESIVSDWMSTGQFLIGDI